MVVALSKRSRCTFVGRVFQHAKTEAPRHCKMCSSSPASAPRIKSRSASVLPPSFSHRDKVRTSGLSCIELPGSLVMMLQDPTLPHFQYHNSVPRVENPRVTGSIPVPGTIFSSIQSIGCAELALGREVPIFGLGFILGFGSVRMKTAKDAKLGSSSFGVHQTCNVDNKGRR